MTQPQQVSARRLQQLKNTARARIEMGQATPLEKAIPELVAALDECCQDQAHNSLILP